MCEFLVRNDDNKSLLIKQLQDRIDAEKHVCDALFATLINSLSNPSLKNIDSTRKLYAKLVMARTRNEFATDIVDDAHKILDESGSNIEHK